LCKIKEMAKVILEFDSLEEADDLKSALDGCKWKSVAWDMQQYLRNKLKYADEDMSDETYEVFEKVQQELNTIISENQLYLD